MLLIGMNNPLNILFSGDIAPRRADMNSMFTHVAPLIRAADISIGQLETVVSERGEASVHAKLAMRTRPGSLPAIRAAGFDGLSFAGNHCMDYGPTAFVDTLKLSVDAGLAVCGAGVNLCEAQRPLTMKQNGVKIAILAYSSILPQGYAATKTAAGCAPLRAHTHYEQIEHDQPGTAARVHTKAHHGDMEDFRTNIRTAKQSHDFVFISMHWGIHFVPIEIADYQKQYAHAAIDCGADGIFGHHPHILKAIEIYKGKPIFYSLGNFAIEQPQVFDPTILKSDSFKHLQSLNPEIDATSLFVCPPDSHYSMLAQIKIEDNHITNISYIPIYIDDYSVPRPIEQSDPLFDEHLEHVREITTNADIQLKFKTSGNEIHVSPDPNYSQ